MGSFGKGQGSFQSLGVVRKLLSVGTGIVTPVLGLEVDWLTSYQFTYSSVLCVGGGGVVLWFVFLGGVGWWCWVFLDPTERCS